MKIDRIQVAGLFGRFNHELAFKPDEPVTIMTGPNGYGKTTVLRILNILLSQPVRRLTSFPFRGVTVMFDDGSRLEAMREPTESENRKALRLIYEGPLGKHNEVLKGGIPERELSFPVGAIEDIVPDLDQVSPRQWRVISTGEIISLEEVFDRFGNQLPDMGSDRVVLPEWLANVRKMMPVRLIDTERLTRPLIEAQNANRFARHGYGPTQQRTVRHYSQELAQRVVEVLAKYGELAQGLDRTFPSRVVQEPTRSEITMDALRAQLNDVETKRKRLVAAGLLVQEFEGWGTQELAQVDEARRSVLAVYARDARKKLEVFDNLLARVDAFKRIANERFQHKQVTVGKQGVEAIALDGSKLDLEMLSSGEQHELVMLYDLLFRVPENSLILIDEPELSLHVAWQEKFLTDLEDMARLSRFHALLATHSPQIIGDRWDLTVELKGPNGA